MISKGVDYYAYLDSTAFETTFGRPVDWGTKTRTTSLNVSGEMQKGNLQISESDIALNSHTGRYAWQVMMNGTTLSSQYAEISPLTGNLGAATLGDMLKTSSQFGHGWAVSYGFYDSGSGIGGLTNQDQSYVYATADLSGWMGDLASDMGPALTDLPFSVFTLPGAHDSGMFDPTCVKTLLEETAFVAALAGVLGVAVDSLAEPIALRAVINLSFTQKDHVQAMLNLGVRYFDFRPGYCYDDIAPGIYHQHNFIPGYPYQQFLQDVLCWLDAHSGEIVVVSPNFQGFNQSTMKPSVATLQGILDAAYAATPLKNLIVVGDKNDLDSSYAQLMKSNKRLIFLPQIGVPNDAKKYDSYNSSYTTADVANILAALNGMEAAGQATCDYTVLQLQGTASGIAGGIFDAVASLSNASSPLMSTKPGFDNATYPWLLNNVAKRLSTPGLVVLLNDFCDNALASVASSITRTRAESQ